MSQTLQSRPRHLLHVFPSFVVGGSQTRFVQLATAHGDRYRHTVYSLDGVFDMARNIAPSVAIECRAPSFDKNAGLRNLPFIRRAIAEAGADVLVTYNWGAIEWCLANRWFPLLPHIHVEDGFGPEETQHQLWRRVLARRVALSGPHTTVVLVSRQLERLARAVWHLSPKAILYIPNGVDCARFTRQEQKTPGQKNRLVIGTLATLRAEKNLARLIRIFAAIAALRPPEALELLIVGDGSERAALEAAARASRRPAQIRFVGHTSSPEHALAEMDIFALSSDTEQMPLSVLEAMAMQLPIAAPSVGDVFDMVASENRPYIAARNNDEELKRSIESLIDDPALRKRLGLANRKEVVERFDWNTTAARYAELFG